MLRYCLTAEQVGDRLALSLRSSERRMARYETPPHAALCMLTRDQILCRKEINYLKMSMKEREQLQAEINILASLRHPNIVEYYHREHIKETQDLHLYMEYCEGGDLSKTINKLAAKDQLADEAFVWNIMVQLISALHRCHFGVDPPAVPDNVMGPPSRQKLRTKDQWTILHRDLKPENIFLIDEDSIRLGDFGLSKTIQGNDFASTYVGTPYYMSPEICGGERYSLKSDIWSLGCIIYELCTTRPPFEARSLPELLQKIRQGTYKPIPTVYSPELQNFIANCLKVNPRMRPTTADLLDIPVVRLTRKEREVTEMGRVLKRKEEETQQLRAEAESLLKTLEHDKEVMRTQIDDTLRREWEVKAALEIDRQVKVKIQAEREAMCQTWNDEFPRSVRTAVEAKIQEFYRAQAAQQDSQRSTSPDTAPNSSVYTSQTTNDDFTTDLSSLSMTESPFRQPPAKKRTTRTPLTRNKARTEFDSPMDVHMASPSPAAINSLSLSPRRYGGATAAAHAAKPSKNLFVLADRGQQWQPLTRSPAETEDDPRGDWDAETDLDDDGDDIPEIPSPTLARQDRINGPLFRGARAGRPSLGRQQTMPARRIGQNAGPTLFEKNSAAAKPAPRATSPVGRPSAGRSTSPTRERRGAGGLKTARTDGDMLRDVMKRNAERNTGRTLVELQQEQMQNRALSPQSELVLPLSDAAQYSTGNKENVRSGRGLSNRDAKNVTMSGVNVMDMEPAGGDNAHTEVAVWDPESCDEMPSPFLNRSKGRGILPA